MATKRGGGGGMSARGGGDFPVHWPGTKDTDTEQGLQIVSRFDPFKISGQLANFLNATNGIARAVFRGGGGGGGGGPCVILAPLIFLSLTLYY